ncbi:MAG: 2-oxo acid dehydrogenase subunit E2 [Myxococcales bacterium]|nr:2-oxo acid dehydrogenase subunit E2 [Myxococcales bacterium]
MSAWLLLGVLVGWAALHLKTSRPDGTLVKDVHPYRRGMHYIMPTRAESVVYFDQDVDAEALLAYLAEARPAFGANVSHALVGAFATALAENPRMNRFVVGRRVYQRNDLLLTFSMKRDLGDSRSKLATLKHRVAPGMTFPALVASINARVGENRTDAVTDEDKELNLFARLPRPLMRFAVGLVRTLDYYNLLPAFFIRGEALYTSMFLANLGSLGMGAGYHHLFEFGTCPAFVMAGEVVEKAVVRDGQVVVRPILPLRFTYDERIDDGMTARGGIRTAVKVLEDPATWLGGVGEQAARPLL